MKNLYVLRKHCHVLSQEILLSRITVHLCFVAIVAESYPTAMQTIRMQNLNEAIKIHLKNKKTGYMKRKKMLVVLSSEGRDIFLAMAIF